MVSSMSDEKSEKGPPVLPPDDFPSVHLCLEKQMTEAFATMVMYVSLPNQLANDIPHYRLLRTLNGFNQHCRATDRASSVYSNCQIGLWRGPSVGREDPRRLARPEVRAANLVR